MSNTERNKKFIQELIESKRPLKEFPDRVSQDLVIHEPAFFPYAGSYYGLEGQEELFSQVGKFYDFSKFKILDIYGEENVVFATLRSKLANSDEEIMICEKLTFSNDKLAEVRVFVFDFPPSTKTGQ